MDGIQRVIHTAGGRRLARVFITGGSGFFGVRLAERLVERHGARVTALVRSLSRAARLARLPVRLLRGEMDDVAALKEGLSEADVVFHLAHDLQTPEKNPRAARLLGELCSEGGVGLIYTSSFAVYDLNGPNLDEGSPPFSGDWDYAVAKLATERALLECHQSRRLPVVIAQPTIVYGPFSQSWTIEALRRVSEHRVALPDEGLGVCNAVYIDDVVSALELCAMHAHAVAGERLLVSGPAPVTWKEFYESYGAMVGRRSVRLIGRERALALLRPGDSLRTRLDLGDPLPALRHTPAFRAYRWLLKSPRLRDLLLSLKRRLPSPIEYPDRFSMALYTSHARVSIEKARQRLGYEPRIDFAEGVRRTAEYARWANLVVH